MIVASWRFEILYMHPRKSRNHLHGLIVVERCMQHEKSMESQLMILEIVQIKCEYLLEVS
jgi:hypothetical protein